MRDTQQLHRARLQNERNAQQDTAAQLVQNQRKMSRFTGGTPTALQEDIAPVPLWMRWSGMWLERAMTLLPMTAPLLLSGYFTAHAFHGAFSGMSWSWAVIPAIGLEGGLFVLVAYLVRTLLEGDSTLGLRATIGIYLTVISSLIYWSSTLPGVTSALVGGRPSMAWVPAAACALLSFLGVRIGTHAARFRYRVALRAAGRVDRQAPKFSAMSWVLCPVETPRALKHAVRYRIESPVLALEDRRLWVSCGRPVLWPLPVRDTAQDGVRDTERPVRDSAPVRQRVPSSLATGRPVPHRPVAAIAPGPARPALTESEVDELEDVLKYASHLLVVTNTFPEWDAGRLPPVRGIRDAIHMYRQQEDGGEFRSMSVAQDVQKALLKLREHPEMLDLMNATADQTT